MGWVDPGALCMQEMWTAVVRLETLLGTSTTVYKLHTQHNLQQFLLTAAVMNKCRSLFHKLFDEVSLALLLKHAKFRQDRCARLSCFRLLVPQD